MRRAFLAACCAMFAAFAPTQALALVVEVGETVTRPVLDATVVNHGLLSGTIEAPLEFGAQATVSGSGRFDHTLVHGVFAPGNSPGITSGTNQAFGATAVLEVELGGPLPGFGTGRHDQVNDSASVFLIGGPTLSVLPYGGYVPPLGTTFKVLTWQTGLVGTFGALQIDPHFTTNGVTFKQQITNPGGPGDLTLVAVAVPEANAWLLTGVVATTGLRRLGRCRSAQTRRPGRS